MNNEHLKRALLLAVAVVAGLSVWESLAQEPFPNIKEVEKEDPSTDASSDKAQIWNSPEMLRARAWLQEYCQASAKITPEQGKAYMQELEQMSASQMKLWLLKFEHEEQQRNQQQQAWQQMHQASLNQALAMQAQQRQALEDVNRGETAAAEQAQGQLEEREREASARASEKLDELNSPPVYGAGYPYWGPYGGYGGYYGHHYHYHLYR